MDDTSAQKSQEPGVIRPILAELGTVEARKTISFTSQLML